MGSGSIAVDRLKREEALPYVAALIDGGFEVEVKTAHGMWRIVAAVYSDGTLGTILPRSTERGRYTILKSTQIARVRACFPEL